MLPLRCKLVQSTAASRRVTSRRQPILTGHRSCEEACLLLSRALALGRRLALGSRGLGSRGLGTWSSTAEGATVGLRHALLHLHLHLVLLGLGHHLRGLLLDGHVTLSLRQLQLRMLLLVRLLNRERLLLVLHLVLGRHLRDLAVLLRLQHAELRLLLVKHHLLLDTVLGREHRLRVLQLRLHRAGIHRMGSAVPTVATVRRLSVAAVRAVRGRRRVACTVRGHRGTVRGHRGTVPGIPAVPAVSGSRNDSAHGERRCT